jgi:hypothetical protein
VSPGAVSRDVVEAFAARARRAGHPIVTAGAGRWPDTDRQDEDELLAAAVVGTGRLAPNDVLDAAREAARRQRAWVHVVSPTLTDAVRLAAAVQPGAHQNLTAPAAPAVVVPGQATHSDGHTHAHRATDGPASGLPGWLRLLRRPTSPRAGLAGDPRQVPFGDLVTQMPLTVRTVTTTRAGRSVHVTEIPAAWLHHLTEPIR